MSDETITVDIVANPRPYAQGMQDAASSTQQAGNVIDASLQRIIADTERLAKSVNSSTSSIGSNMRDFMSTAKQVEAAMMSQAKTAEEVAAKQMLYSNALKAGILTQEEYAVASKVLEKQQLAIKPAAEAAAAGQGFLARALAAMGGSAAQAQKELGVLTGELARGNTAAFERSLITLTRQTGLLGAIFSTAGAAVLAVIATIGGFIAAIVAGYNEQQNFNKALVATGNFAGETSSSLVQMTRDIGQATGKFGDAQEAVTHLAQSGRMGGEALRDAAQGAVAFAEITGQSVEKAADAFIKLTKDPVKNIDELNQQYHFLTLSVYDQIDALDKAGKSEEASDLAIKSASEAFESRAKTIQDNAGYIEKAWRGAKEAVSEFVDELKQIGQTGTQIEFANATLEKQRLDVIANNKALADQGDLWAGLKVRLSGTLQGYTDARAANDKLLESLTNKMSLEKEAAEGEKKDHAAQDNAIAAASAIDKMAASLDKTIKKQQELTKLKQDFDKLWAGNTNGDDPRMAGVTKDDSGNFHGGLYDQLAASIEKDAAAARAAARDTAVYNKVMSDLNNTITTADQVADDLAKEYSGPAETALRAYNKEIDKLGEGLDAAQAKLALGKMTQEEYDKKLEEYAAAAARAGDKLDGVVEKQAALNLLQEDGGDAVQRLLASYKQELSALGLSDAQREVVNEKLKVEKELRAAIKQAIEEGHPEYAQQLQDLLGQVDGYARATVAAKLYADQAKKIQEDFQNIFKSGFTSMADTVGQFFTGQLNGWKDFKSKMVDIVKQMIGQMISQFLQLSIIGPIMQSLFGGLMGGSGGGMGFLGSLASSAFTGGAGGVTAAAGATFMGGGSNAAAGQGGWQSALGNGASAYQLWNGGSSAVSGPLTNFLYGGTTANSGMFGAWTPGDPGMFGFGMNGSGTFAPSTLGWGASIAGGVYAGYNRYQNSQGGFGGALGGATYGVGTAAVGLGVASLATGGSFAAGVGAMGALGPIGWAAIALMAVDMLSGGKLFGTKGKFNYGEQTISTSATGATLSQGYDLKGQKAFFGGSTHKWVTTDVDPKAQEAADAFFDAVTKQMVSVGKTFGIKAGEVIDASFTQTFDKHGNITKHVSTVGGETFDEDAQHFQERVGALSVAGTLDKLGIDVTGYVNQFKQDADAMAQAVQDATDFLTAAKSNVDAGIGLLTGQKTLKDIWNFVQSAQQAGEGLSQTYQRLTAAAAQYNGIMQGVNQQLQQLWAGTDPGRQFAVAIVNIGESTKKTISDLNAAARAAGLQGAKEEDLARVHALAASQAAAAMQQLKAAGLGLVDALYGTGTLQGQIDAIMNKSQQAANATRNFGNAAQVAAQQMQAAAQLMLGDLSPLNDQMKLQYALQAYQKGAVDKDAVLEIGRRLYGTSQQYNDLFSQLQGMRGGIHDNSGGGGGSSGGLSASDQARVNELQHQLDAQNRALQAQQLASVVATMMEAQGATSADIADQLNFKLSDLAKDLNMSQDELNDYLAKLEENNDAVPDSITSNVDRLIDVLRELLDPNYQSGPTVDAIREHGHSTHQAINRNTDAVHNNTDAVNNGADGGHRGARGHSGHGR